MAVAACLLARSLAEPASVAALDKAGWTALLTVARAELLAGALAHRVAAFAPVSVRAILDDARASAEQGRTVALWEAEMARRALAPLGVPIVLLKGTAFVAAGLAAGQGRSIGDLDILVPSDALDPAEAALLAGGWEWVKPDAYDDGYYRRWMHELPPLIHRERDRMIDVHHTILPPTARRTPDAAALIAESRMLGNGLHVLSPEDMVIHAAAHLFADGDLTGGLRNLWDIDRLCREFADGQNDFYPRLYERARLQDLRAAVGTAMRLTREVFGTPVVGATSPLGMNLDERWTDRLIRRRLLSRDGWGRGTRPATRLAFYVRSHAIRMPPAMLARHLWIKWRRRP